MRLPRHVLESRTRMTPQKIPPSRGRKRSSGLRLLITGVWPRVKCLPSAAVWLGARRNKTATAQCVPLHVITRSALVLPLSGDAAVATQVVLPVWRPVPWRSSFGFSPSWTRVIVRRHGDSIIRQRSMLGRILHVTGLSTDFELICVAKINKFIQV